MAVYFAEAGGYIKIGYSANPLARVASITRLGKRPEDLPRNTRADLIGWVPGDEWQEGAIQAQFVDRRVAGEWFRIDRDEVVELIRDHPAGIDFKAVSSQAAFASIEWPGITRDEMQAAGIRVAARSLDEVRARAAILFAGGTLPEDGAA